MNKHTLTMHEKPKLSAWEMITLLGAVIRTLTILLATSVTALFRGPSGAPTYKKHLVYKAVRTITSSTTIRHSHAVAGYTSDVYKTFAKKKNIATELTDIGNGTIGCWIGDKNAGTVLLWFHGGGYVFMATEGHFDLMWNIMLQGADQGKQISAFVLQYDVAPYARYPTQLTQATAALRYLIKDVAISPSQIMVGGDSAGGNLTLALMSHIMHSHPQVPKLSLGDEFLKGIILISPSVTSDQSAPAFKNNAQKDVLSATASRKWSKAFRGDAVTDNYNTPLNAPASWWADLPVKNTIILAGADELLVDDIIETIKKIKGKNGDKVESYIGQGECHDSPLLEISFGFGVGKQTRRLYEWLAKYG